MNIKSSNKEYGIDSGWDYCSNFTSVAEYDGVDDSITPEKFLLLQLV
jgi:hypothetical protein